MNMLKHRHLSKNKNNPETGNVTEKENIKPKKSVLKSKKTFN